MTSTFWGLRLEPGKRYSTTVDKSFHVSMAALDCSTVKNDKDVQSVMLEEGESNIPFILCNLQKPKVLQSRLDLNFMSGDRVTFFCRGNGTVHLTGYIMPDDDDDFANFGDEEEGEEVEEEEEEEDDEDETEEKEIETGKGKAKLNGLPAKRKGDTDVSLPPKKKKQELQSQEDSEDSDEEEEVEEEEDDDSGEEEEDEGEEVEEEESEEESDEENVDQEAVKKTTPPPANLEKKSKKKKKNKQNQQSPPNAQQQQQQQQQGKQKQQNAEQQQKKKPQQQGQPGADKQSPEGQPKKTLEGGVIIKDIKVGSGPLCKPGRMATVYYTGRLKSNNKVFDQSQHGAGFKFRVGRGEVIKGWDIGLTGMKVGGKRLITCPPSVA